ncbi:TlpA family protein disulfide reductase [Dyadobacter sp. CY312]|uniref:TlpA family protein disulfide reductase n=1 Tax=Dyadobacter sp. CY312 TaxID=2907303 RepID=UPI001F36F883|nr:TlpA family protein disulfide reductase [Dyadobacter sp. CY312]MCE7044532.1 TlpA family protein disulfide reductase [Dyadobacter sp. CY312]
MNSRFCSPGKLLPYLFYLLVSYLLMMCWKPVRAQSLADLKPLQIGDTVPDVTIENILHYKTPTAKLSDFKGKLLILDFWATWCSPCVAMIPKMDSLQKQFEGRVQFLSVTYQSEKEVSTFFEKYTKRKGKRIALPEVVGDTLLRKTFYHNALPHYVWIGPDGVIKAITNFDQVSAKKITSMLQQEQIALPQKKDEKRIPYSNQTPLLANGNGGDGSNLLYHSVLTAYTKGLKGGFSWKIDSLTGRRITMTNCTRLWFYRLAYGRPGGWLEEGNVSIEVKDDSKLTSSLHGNSYLDWLQDDNGFCYEVIVPAHFQRQANEIMQQDLRDFFPEYSAFMEKRKRQCLALKRIGKQNLHSAGGKPEISLSPLEWKVRNVSAGALIDRLNKTQNYKLPFVDQTGLKGPIDLDVSAGVSDIKELNEALLPYGLEFIKTEHEQDVLIIQDSEDSKKQ